MAVTLYEGTRYETTFRSADLIDRIIGDKIKIEVTKFSYKGNEVLAVHNHGESLKVELKGKENEEEIIETFRTALGYSPFVRYKGYKDNEVYEWNFNGPQERLKKLEREAERNQDVKNLERLS